MTAERQVKKLLVFLKSMMRKHQTQIKPPTTIQLVFSPNFWPQQFLRVRKEFGAILTMLAPNAEKLAVKWLNFYPLLEQLPEALVSFFAIFLSLFPTRRLLVTGPFRSVYMILREGFRSNLCRAIGLYP